MDRELKEYMAEADRIVVVDDKICTGRGDEFGTNFNYINVTQSSKGIGYSMYIADGTTDNEVKLDSSAIKSIKMIKSIANDLGEDNYYYDFNTIINMEKINNISTTQSPLKRNQTIIDFGNDCTLTIKNSGARNRFMTAYENRLLKIANKIYNKQDDEITK